MAEPLPESLHTAMGARLADLQGHACAPVLAPALASAFRQKLRIDTKNTRVN